jgi:hypothetical protein
MGDKSRKRLAPGRHEALAELAARQHGVVSIRQLTARLGYSRNAISRAVREGRLHRIHRGVYAVGHTSLSAHGQALGAVLACGSGSLLSHHSAGWLWDIAKVEPAPFHVTTSVWRTPRPPLRLHQSLALAPEDRALREGIPVTSLPRTFLDLAAAVKFEWLEKMVERSEELRLFDLRAIEELLARTAGHHGHKRLRRAIALYEPTSFTRSGLEKRFLRLVLDAGLPQPHMNYVEHGFELDCYWPEHRFVVELDVFETHGTHAAFERDRKRQEDLLLLGIHMIRVTGPRLEREPEEVIRRVARLLSEREPCRVSSRP